MIVHNILRDLRPQDWNSSLNLNEPHLKNASDLITFQAMHLKPQAFCVLFPYAAFTDMVKCSVHACVKACGLWSKISIHGRDHLMCSERFARSRGEPREGFKNDRYEEAKRNKEIKYSNSDLF